MPLSDKTREAAERLKLRYPVSRSALLPLLHLVQADQGYVSDDGIAFCAETLGLTKAEVGAVATFYTMFKREPVGDYLLSVCTNPTCKIAGAQAIYERYLSELGGHTDAERGVSVEHAECLGICDAAPVVQVNYEMYGPLTQQQADELLAAVLRGSPPPSNWSGEVPGTFQEVEWDLSGAGDGVDEQLIAAARAQAQAAAPPSYRSGETDIPVTHPGGDVRGHGGELFRATLGQDATPGGAGVPAPDADAQVAPAGVSAATPDVEPSDPASPPPGVVDPDTGIGSGAIVSGPEASATPGGAATPATTKLTPAADEPDEETDRG